MEETKEEIQSKSIPISATSNTSTSNSDAIAAFLTEDDDENCTTEQCAEQQQEQPQFQHQSLEHSPCDGKYENNNTNNTQYQF